MIEIVENLNFVGKSCRVICLKIEFYCEKKNLYNFI